METPVRRVTRSQISGLNPSSAVKPPGRMASSTKKNELPRPALSDLTNDSPISGLMPAKMATKSGCVYESTPRSKLRPTDRPIGEDLLRMQVNTLLRKVEAEAVMQTKTIPCVSDLLESPMRLAAPTPANTPATSGYDPVVAQPAAMLPPIAISSPVCTLEVALNVERRSPAFVSTAELLLAMEKASPKLMTDGSAAMDHEHDHSTTRTLRFDSPDRSLPAAMNQEDFSHSPTTEIPSSIESSPPSSVSTGEILSSIAETSTIVDITMVMDETEAQESVQPTTRTLRFESPDKHIFEVEEKPFSTALPFESPQKLAVIVPDLGVGFSPCVHYHETDDEDSWSVIVNIHSPEQNVQGSLLETVITTPEEHVHAMEFAENVLVDPEHRIEIPVRLWQRRDTPARMKSSLKDAEDDEDFAEEYDEDYEESYEDGPEVFDEACEELCKGISHINMGDSGLPAFQGKHIRFNYNSDDEIEEHVVTDRTVDSPGKLRLNGLPTPKGKHLRFRDEGDSDRED